MLNRCAMGQMYQVEKINKLNKKIYITNKFCKVLLRVGFDPRPLGPKH